MMSLHRTRLTQHIVIGLLTLIGAAGSASAEDPAAAWDKLAPFFKPPAELANDFGGYESPLAKAGGEIASPEEWAARRLEILRRWRLRLGEWPKLLEKPTARILETERRENFTQHRMMLQVAPPHEGSETGESLETNAILMVPDGAGPFPAVLVTFYEPLSSAGLMKDLKGHHDYAYQLAKRGYLTLAIGTPGSRNFGRDTRPALNELGANYHCQPLGFLAYIAANCHTFLAQRPDVDRERIGVAGLSYGGKWAMFASCLYDKFACAVWGDPGIVFDESNRNINYYEPWYLGYDMKSARQRKPGVPTAENPRTGLYKELMDSKSQLVDFHALAAPRPVLVSGGTEDKPERWKALNHLVRVNKVLGQADRVGLTSRETHVPDPLAAEQTVQFFDVFLKGGGAAVAELGPGAPAEPSPLPSRDVMIARSDAVLRDAVVRGLAVLQKGAANYPSHRQCFSCHHQTMPLLAQRTIRNSRFETDGRRIEPIPVDGVLHDAITRFSHQTFAGKHESLREGTGIGGRALTVGYGLWTLDVAGSPRDETTDAMIEYLLKTQEDDGHWNFHSLRPPASSSIQMTSALSVLGLIAYRTAENGDRVDAALRKAKEWFHAQDPDQESHEDLIGTIWGRYLGSQLSVHSREEERRIGFQEEFRSSIDLLVQRQRHDGGWSQLPDMQSDAYATGQSLVMLQHLGYGAKSPAYRRGEAFLLNTQKPDGSWHVVTRAKPVQVYFDNGDPHGKDQFLSIMATGWATTALAVDLGAVEKPLAVRQRK